MEGQGLFEFIKGSKFTIFIMLVCRLYVLNSLRVDSFVLNDIFHETTFDKKGSMFLVVVAVGHDRYVLSICLAIQLQPISGL